jgi:tetratricopeptide (TPR) repeat protein
MAATRAEKGAAGSGATGAGSARRNRQGGRRGQPPPAPARQAAPRRQAERGARYAFGRSLAAMALPAQLLVGLGMVVFIGIVVGFGLLFAYNVQLIMADVNYRTGQNYESSAAQYTSTSLQAQAQQGDKTALSEYQQGLGFYQTAIDNYQQALNDEPSQDNYFLFLGKALLEYADAVNRDPGTPSAAARHANAVAQIQQSLSVFQRAEKNNPLNPDHPRNIAKLYSFWAMNVSLGHPDVALLRLADQSYSRAAALAPHNADILDEWAALDIKIGGIAPQQAHQWYADARAHLERAESLFPEDGNVYRDLGYVYYQDGSWAAADKDTTLAQSYYLQAKTAWLKALGGAPVTSVATNYQSIYPSLANLFLVNLHDLCDAGQYAQFALNAYKAGTLYESAQVMQTLQSTVTSATARKCVIKQQ